MNSVPEKKATTYPEPPKTNNFEPKDRPSPKRNGSPCFQEELCIFLFFYGESHGGNCSGQVVELQDPPFG